MKTIVILFVLMLSTVSFAQSVVIKEDTNPDLLNQYKEAAQRALYVAGKNKCVYRPKTKDQEEGAWVIADEIDLSDEVVVTDGVQPLLTFNQTKTRFYDAGSIKVILTTSSDYKFVTGVMIQAFRKARVNIGDLKNPNMTDSWEIISDVTCRL